MNAVISDAPPLPHDSEQAASDTRPETDIELAPHIAQAARGRSELGSAVAQLRAPLHSLQTAQRTLRFTQQSLPWFAMAGSLATVMRSLRLGRRPPLMVLMGLSWQLYGVWNRHQAQSATERSSRRVRPEGRQDLHPRTTSAIPVNIEPGRGS